MKILVLGSGGREHSIATALAQSTGVKEVTVAPGNAGIARTFRCRPEISLDDVGAITKLATEEMFDLVVVGPEKPLSVGVADALRKARIPVAGPNRGAALLEASKAFAKEVMAEAGVPTASFEVFTDRTALENHVRKTGAPLVLKADGLAAGKGVVVVLDEKDFDHAIPFLMDELGAKSVLAEEYIDGVEATLIIATNGREVVVLPAAHDYKRLRDDDQGPNTGGMGSVSPSPRIRPEDISFVVDKVALPTLRTMEARGTPFAGFLYIGLMLPRALDKRPAGIRVLEYNARLGDPECQSMLSRIDSGFVELCEWIAGIRIEKPEIKVSNDTAVCLVIASPGYPENPIHGGVMEGEELASLVSGVKVFHAGTALDAKGRLVTSGGRVLGVTARAPTLEGARSKAYQAADLIQFTGRQMRRDIGS